MKKAYLFTLLLTVAAGVLIGCSASGGSGSGSANKGPNPPQNNFAGAWEFVMTSAVFPSGGGNTNLMEAIITQNGNNLTATGQQVQVVGLIPGAIYPNNVFVDGICGAGATPTPGTNTINGVVTAQNGKATSVSFTFNTGGVNYAASVVVNLDGTISGTYVGGSGACVGDAGIVVGYGTNALSGTYLGVLSIPANNAITANVKEANNYALTVGGIPGVSLTGSVVGNVALASGTINTIPVSLFVFADPTGAFTGFSGSLSMFDSKTAAFYGTLTSSVGVASAAPEITAISPGSGSVGTLVTVSGSGFGASQGSSTVTFNGDQGLPSSWNSNSIVVPVPGNATTGSVVVTVNGLSSNGVTFVVQASPVITSVSPTSAVPGTLVTITGTNFGVAQGTSMISFNGSAATVTNWSSSSISAIVPTSATTGNVVVTVGGVPSNGLLFTVL